jgi:muramoyltetrapeptide carboxypeptidase
MERTSLKASCLNKGDTVGIVSPSGPIPDDLKSHFNHGINYLKSLGLYVKLAPHVFDNYFYSAGKREDRLSDLNSFWDDSDITMILMSLGGSTALQIVDGIDYDTIKKHPKIFSGISDGTTLLNAIYAKTNLITFHGPDFIFTFGRKMSPMIEENIISTFFKGEKVFFKPNINWKYENDPTLSYCGWKWLRDGIARGELVGGHSNSFTHLLLSGYGPSLDGKILFLEGTDKINRLDREFSSLRVNGVFDKINGLVIGWFDDFSLENEKQNRAISELILELTLDYSFPILEIGELGHYVENYVLPIGCMATLDSTTNRFSVDENPLI